MTYLSVIAGAAALVAVSAVPANVQTCDQRPDKPLTSSKSAGKPKPSLMFLSKGRTARA